MKNLIKAIDKTTVMSSARISAKAVVIITCMGWVASSAARVANNTVRRLFYKKPKSQEVKHESVQSHLEHSQVVFGRSPVYNW